MACCHADFALVEGSDRGFTRRACRRSRSARGVLAEAGDNAARARLEARRALHRPQARRRRARRQGQGVARGGGRRRRRLRRSGDRAHRRVAPGRRALRRARRSVDGYVSVGGGSVMDTCKAANLYATHPAEFMTYVNAPIGAGQRVPGPVKPHIACPTTSGTGSETTGIAIFTLRVAQRQDRHHLAPPDSRRSRWSIPTSPRTLPANVVAATGFDCMSHALESMTARAVSAPAQSRAGRRPAGVAGRQSVLRRARRREALKSVGQFLVRAVDDASDAEARTEMMYAAMLAGIAFNAAGCHLPHGLSYAVSGLTQGLARRRLSGRQDARAARHGGRAQQSVGVAPHGARRIPQRHLQCAHASAPTIARRDARRRRRSARRPRDRVDARDATCRTALPRSASTKRTSTRSPTGAEPQYRVIKNAPMDVGRDELDGAVIARRCSYW